MRSRNRDDPLGGMLAPLLTTREVLYRNSLTEDEWMCIVCGFDNKPRSACCVLCGTLHTFSSDYKDKEKARKRIKRERMRSLFTASTISEEHTPLLPSVPVRDSEDLRSSVSMSLKHFTPQTTHHQAQGQEQQEDAPSKPSAALSLRQRGARRRKLWQRMHSPLAGTLIWTRLPCRQTIIGQTRFGYTPQGSITGASRNRDRERGERGERGEREFSDESSQRSFSPLAALLAAARGSGSPVRGTNTPLRDSFDDPAFSSLSPGYVSLCDGDSLTVRWVPVHAGDVVREPYTSQGVLVQQGSVLMVPVVLAPAPGPQGAVQQGQRGIVNAADSLQRIGDLLHSLTAEAAPSTPAGAPAPAPVEDVDLVSIAGRTFRGKSLWFLDRTAVMIPPIASGFMRISIARTSILQDSFTAVMSVSYTDMRKVFKFTFLGEAGIDAGGLERDWYSSLVSTLFDTSKGFFVACNAKTAGGGGYHINPMVHMLYGAGAARPMGMDWVTSYLQVYEFAGRLIAKALLSQQIVHASLCIPLRKAFLGVPVTFEDLEFVDEELYRNLLYLKNLPAHAVESLSLDFSIAYAFNGQTVVHELLPGGADIPVTDANRQEYLNARLR